MGVDEADLPSGANVVSSHVVYKVKSDENCKKSLKARICPHGNEKSDNDSVRNDFSNAQLAVVRLLLAIVTFLGFKTKTAGVTGAYLQSGPIKRNIYIRSPRERN